MRRILNPLIGVGVLVLVWQAAKWVWGTPKYILPSPADVWRSVGKNWVWLLESSWPTVQEIMLGFGISVAVGVPLAVILATFPKIEDVVYPVLVVTQTVPKVAIAPLFLIWFGFGMTPKILIAFLIAFFPIVVDTVVGLKSVPQDLHDLVASTGASWSRGLRTVSLPHALPSIFGGLKLAITFATIGAIVGEFVGTSEGLGYVIQIANGRLDTALVFAAVIILSVMGLLLFQVVSLIERISIPWHISQRSH